VADTLHWAMPCAAISSLYFCLFVLLTYGEITIFMPGNTDNGDKHFIIGATINLGKLEREFLKISPKGA